MDTLETNRAEIDAIDDQIIDLLARRTDIVRRVAQYKAENNIPAVLPDRVKEVRESAAEKAGDRGLDPDIVRQMYQILIEYSCNLEEELGAATYNKAG